MARKHAFTSSKADGADATEVRPTDWNDEHVGGDEIDRDVTLTAVTNTVDETTIYTVSIPAGALGTDGGFRLELAGMLLKNATGTSELKVKLGATTVFDGGGVGHADAAARYAFKLVIICLNVTASSQKWSAEWQSVLGQSGVEPNMGWQLISQTDALVASGFKTSAENTAGALTFELTWKWSAANASLSLQPQFAILTLIPPSI